jgi:hypothetical protein
LINQYDQQKRADDDQEDNEGNAEQAEVESAYH